MKLALVVQRYGAGIAGGSEAHCRQLALRLRQRHEVTVLTTCARDYVTWANALPAGTIDDEGVTVRRFPVARPRRLSVFRDLSDEVFDGGSPRQRQEEWFQENGPDAPALLDELRTRGREYDLVLFWTYRYATSYFGLPIVADRAILVPTAEEDPAIDLDVLEEFFAKPAGYLFMTPEEETLVSSRARRSLSPSGIVGTGIDPAAPAPPSTVLAGYGLADDFFLYLGRIDRNKGCDTLLDYFQEYAGATPSAMLVLAGPATMQVPSHPQVRALGYVPDAVRAALLARATALVVPSPYESLSIVLLEAWNAGTPAVVNGRCRVLAGQVARADGGLPYRSASEFAAALEYLRTHPDERRALGRQGLAYVEREYRWPTVLARVEQVLDAVSSRRLGSAVR